MMPRDGDTIGRPPGRKTGADLNAIQVKRLKEGYYRASHGLFVQVSERGSKSWVQEYTFNGSKRYKGLGSCDLVTLAEAREIVLTNRKLIASGIDPLVKAKPPISHSFRDVAAMWLTKSTPGWSSARYAAQVQSKLERLAYPVLGDLDVANITTEDVLAVLKPIWLTMNPSAVVLRGYIEAILAYAKPLKWRTGDNPAAWKENLQELLTAPTAVHTPEKHPSLHHSEIAEFMATLRAQNAYFCLELLILTALRSNECLGVRWPEINLAKRVWTVPASRMKERKTHVVPLSDRAVALFQAMPREGDLVAARTAEPSALRPSRSQANDLVFFMGANDLRLAMAKLLAIKSYRDHQSGEPVVVHGFRASFSTWATEAGYDPVLIETALAHATGTEVSRRYQRSDMIVKRAELMAAWAAHCG